MKGSWVGVVSAPSVFIQLKNLIVRVTRLLDPTTLRSNSEDADKNCKGQWLMRELHRMLENVTRLRKSDFSSLIRGSMSLVGSLCTMIIIPP